MGDAAVLFLAFLWSLFGGGSGTSRQPRPSTVVVPPQVIPPSSPPPWPQALPSGLPPFPGREWEYDEPPPAAVVRRAQQLVDTLWRSGAGSHRIEQTSGRWIAYRAEIVRSGKKGVTAYRLASERPRILRPAQPPPRQPAPARPAPAPMPRATPVPRPQPAPQRTPVSTTTPRIELPMLRRGAGIKPAAPDPNVRLLQQKLGIATDGQFGAGTEAAVKAFQRRAGLQVDGIVGPATWTALFAVRA